MDREIDPVSAVLETAMRLNKRVSFLYDHKPRTVEVHAVGLSKTGKPCFRAYQVDGGSISGETPAWKLFLTDRIHQLPMILEQESEAPRQGYQKDDKGMSYVDAQLDVSYDDGDSS